MKKNKYLLRRVLPLVLAASMIFGNIPAFAADEFSAGVEVWEADTAAASAEGENSAGVEPKEVNPGNVAPESITTAGAEGENPAGAAPEDIATPGVEIGKPEVIEPETTLENTEPEDMNPDAAASGETDSGSVFGAPDTEEEIFGDDSGQEEFFASEDALQAISDGSGSGEEEAGEDENLDYIKGRPLTEEERQEQLEPFRNLKPLPAGPEINSTRGVPRTRTAFPPRFDARDFGYVTSVKNQYNSNLCWGFSQAAIMETALLAAGLGTYDLSEEHLAYFFANRVNDPLGNTPDDRNHHGGVDYRDSGNDMLASLFLSTWSGMTTEEDVPFYPAATSTYPPEKAYNVAAYLTDAVFSDYSVSYMKQLLVEYYAVSIMYYADDRYYQADTAAYCCDNAALGVNHIVTVVGWDDTYSCENFGKNGNGEFRVAADGAWIVKNSWGPGNGDNGYLYISYEDATISSLVAVKADTSRTYINNYFYDGSSGGSAYLMTPGVSYASVFTAKAGNGWAEALGEISLATYTDNNVFDIQIYTDVTDDTNPQSGTPAFDTPFRYVQRLAGISTVQLPQEVMMAPGSKFSVVVKNAGNKDISFAFEESYIYDWVSFSAGMEAGQSFRLAGKSWTDYCNGDSLRSPRIKAYTRAQKHEVSITLSDTSLTLDVGQQAVISTEITPALYANTGVTYESANDAVATVDEGGNITAVGPGTTDITCTGKAGGNPIAVCQVTVKPVTPVNIKAEARTGNQIFLSWSSVSGHDGYIIYRKEGTQAEKELKRVAGSVTTYTDATAKERMNYTYRVRSYITNSRGMVYSGYSSAASAATKAVTPLQPASVKAVSRSYNKIALSWSGGTGHTSYVIYRREGSGAEKKLATVSGGVTSYADKSLTTGRKYTYRVRACIGNSYSSYSAAATAAPALSVPTVTAKASAKVYNTLSWTKVSGASGYIVYRRLPKGKWSKIATIRKGSTIKYTDKKAKSLVSYQYTVKAYRVVNKKNVYGKYKASAAIKTAPVKQAIKSITRVKKGLRLTWTAQKKCDGYRIYKKKGKGSWVLIKQIRKGSASSYTDTKAKKGVTYTYCVRAYCTEPYGSVYSQYSSRQAKR